MKLLLLLFIFPFCSYSQLENDFEYKIATFDSAVDEIYTDIWIAENSIFVPYSEISWIHADGIVCLSGIRPKKWDHMYSGISFKPTFEEINKWKSWFEQNKQSIRYSTEPQSQYGYKTIVFEYAKGKFRRNDCMYVK